MPRVSLPPGVKLQGMSAELRAEALESHNFVPLAVGQRNGNLVVWRGYTWFQPNPTAPTTHRRKGWLRRLSEWLW